MTAGGHKQRLDQVLVARGLVDSRERAQGLIMAGAVFTGDRRLDKAGMQIAVDAPLAVRGHDHPFVSRGGVKLAGALDAVGLSVAAMICGASAMSTGVSANPKTRHPQFKIFTPFSFH